MFKQILVAVDNGQPAACAFDAAVELSMQLGAELTVLHVVDITEAYVPQLGYADQDVVTKLYRDGEQLLGQVFARLPSNLNPQRQLIEGEPVDVVLSVARDWPADLIVIGNDNRGRLSHFLLGSTADAIVRRASCPVVTVRADARVVRDKASQTVVEL